MPTKNPRLNVVLDPEIYANLSRIAKKKDASLSVVAKELIEDALDRHEDRALSRLAMKREEESTKTISHEDAWK
jgi:predicted transcriptional regulator